MIVPKMSALERAISQLQQEIQILEVACAKFIEQREKPKARSPKPKPETKGSAV